jgi:hypothetical protein
MDHLAPAPELARPWRTATLIATGIAAVELVLLIAAGLVLLGRHIAPDVHAAAVREAKKPKHAAVRRAPVKPAPARPHRPVLKPRAQTRVLVLNGNGVEGAAALAASLAQARGYPAPTVGNAPHTGYAKTMVQYAPRYRKEALRFARDLNLSVVAPLDGMKPSQLKGAHLVEILGLTR